MSRILVIDDDKFVRISIRTVLEAAGYEVDEARNGSEGVMIQKQHVYDAIIVDLMMPHKDGLETIRELKKDNVDVPVVAISGGGDIVRQNFVKTALVFGAQATLEKPFDGDELLSTLSSIITQATDVA